MTLQQPLSSEHAGEALVEAIAALYAVDDFLAVLNGADHPVGEALGRKARFVKDTAYGLEPKSEDDSWCRDPLNVEISARADELVAELLELLTVGGAATRYRTQAAQKREARTIDVD